MVPKGWQDSGCCQELQVVDGEQEPPSIPLVQQLVPPRATQRVSTIARQFAPRSLTQPAVQQRLTAREPHQRERQTRPSASPSSGKSTQVAEMNEEERMCNSLEKNYSERLKYPWHPGGFNAFCLLALNK